MGNADDNKITNQDIITNSILIFYETVGVLSKDAKSQCEMMDYYNVAFELVDDAIRYGGRVLEFGAEKISLEQSKAITKFLDEIQKVPEVLTHYTTTVEDNINAMSHPFWDPIRKHSAKLIPLLIQVKTSLLPPEN